MGKKRTSASEASAERTNGDLSFLAGGQAIDPSLASLFDQSAGPVAAPQYTAQEQFVSRKAEQLKKIREGRSAAVEDDGSDEEMLDGDEDDEEEQEEDEEEQVSSSDEDEEAVERSPSPPLKRKRKRDEEDDLEESYMRRLARDDDREHKRRLDESTKRRDMVAEAEDEDENEESDSESSSESSSGQDQEEDDDEAMPPPIHESLNADPSAVEKATRTVFLGNVSSEVIKSKSAKKTLLTHLKSFFPSLESESIAPKIESIRFRSTAYVSSAAPKRAAYAKRELMDSTTRSTNAYAVYNTVAAARQALRLNGSIVLDRHLRVDSVAHPSKIDHKRCVFVGNLSFVDEEEAAGDGKEQKRKSKAPADVEEGLWRTFNKHAKSAGNATSTPASRGQGTVESVRVVRDPATRVGKGFAYVQFYDENSVEAALLLDGKKFPPLLPRNLRVVRAKRNAGQKNTGGDGNRRDVRTKTPLGKQSNNNSLAGRAPRLFGRAGAAQLRNKEKMHGKSGGAHATGANAVGTGGGVGTGTHVVFEGFRATEDRGFKFKTKSRGAKARGGKPKTRSAKRAKAWKAKKTG